MNAHEVLPDWLRPAANSGIGVAITNAAFVQGIFGEIPEGEFVWGAAFSADPGSQQANWGGSVLHGPIPDYTNQNGYYSVATLSALPSGGLRRRKENFASLRAVVLDDAGECDLQPTYRIRTSSDKLQLGFKLAIPLTDAGVAERLHKELGRGGRIPADKSGNNPVRYVRLPVAVNTKHSPPFKCDLEFFDPNITHTMDDVIAGLGLNRDYILHGTETAQPTRSHAAFVEGDIGENQRNATLASMAGSMRRRGMSYDGIEAALQAENVSRCKPPLDEAEVRAISKSISRYAPTPNDGPADFERLRREQQKRDNEVIGEGATSVPIAEEIVLDAMLERFIFMSEGSRVIDLANPTYCLGIEDFAKTYAGSKQVINDGTSVKKVPVTTLWRESPKRKTVVTQTFKAGGDLILKNPNGLMAANSWRPFDRPSATSSTVDAGLFLRHLQMLFPEEAAQGRFLDWLAHIEQQPGVLPHTAWLHIAPEFGLGRNWLASVLTRVWAGNVASNFNLAGAMKNGFNGPLSRKVLAIVDEINEGARDSHWEHAETLKSMITEETRLINPKYGRQHVEFNSCRLLMFSNHLTALPIENKDRRIEVVVLDAKPQGADYYQQLYGALGDKDFIAAVARYLGERDLSRFNPGAIAVFSESKARVAQATRSPMADACADLVRRWPSDIITTAAAYDILSGQSANKWERGELTAAHRRMLLACGAEPRGPIKIEGQTMRAYILRNCSNWRNAEPHLIRAELVRGGADKALGGLGGQAKALLDQQPE
jgi:hypothetical protein